MKLKHFTLFQILIFSTIIFCYGLSVSNDYIVKNNTNLQEVVYLRGGGQDTSDLSFVSPKLSPPAFTKPPVRPLEPGAGSLPKPAQPGTGNERPTDRITMKQMPGPGGDPGGSGSGSGGFDFDSPEELKEKLNPDKVMDDTDFWRNLENPKDSNQKQSQNLDNEKGVTEPEEDITEIEEKNLNTSPPSSPPTYELEKEYRKQYDFRTNSKSPPVRDTDWEGQKVVLKRDEIGKANFGHPDFIETPDDAIVPCILQSDPTKFQRERCSIVTDKSESLYQAAILKHIKSRDKGMVKVYMKKMPYYQSQPAIGYLNINTGECSIFHLPNSKNELKYWSHKTYDDDGIAELLKDALSVKYANQFVGPAPTVPSVKPKLPPMEKNIPPKYNGEF